MEKELKIVPPEGYEIDKENSTFECIKFKPIKPLRWRDREDKVINGYWLSSPDDPFLTEYYKHNCYNYGVFTTKQLTKSASAMAKISQIMANDERFGGIITYEEWSEEDENILATIIEEGYLKPSEKQWLKSLKNRVSWKPSNEQMEVLLSEVEGWTKGCPKQKVLESLYNDLKKLK